MQKLRELNHKIKVGDKIIARGNPTFIIAEIGNNHNGDLVLAKKSVIEAAKAGADAVKFQKRILDEVFTRELLDKPQSSSRSLGNTYGEYRRKLELKDEAWGELRDLAHKLGMAFFVTPFDLKSARILSEIGMDAWKIASFDLHHLPLIEFVAKQKMPIFISTGMSKMEEIDEAIDLILKYNDQIVIKHCVSVYPTPDENLNLGAIISLADRYNPLPIGYSGHEIGYIPTISAVSMGASSVERHFTLDKTLPGPDHATVSLDPHEFSNMVRDIRRIEKAVYDKKIYLQNAEVKTRDKHSKSIVAKKDIKKNEIITADMITCKSPGYGLKPNMTDSIIGKKATQDIAVDDVIISEFINLE